MQDARQNITCLLAACLRRSVGFDFDLTKIKT